MEKREREIEEMARDVLNSSILSIEDASDVAKSLYNRGYRKESEVAREIFKELENVIVGNQYGEAKILISEYLKLEKKYTEEKIRCIYS